LKLLTGLPVPRCLRPISSVSEIGHTSGRRNIVHVIFGLVTVCSFFLMLGCDEYNPYLGASPIISSSITSISPSGVIAGGSSDVLLTVTGAGFVPGSNVTWNSSSNTGFVGASVYLVSNYINAGEIQANLPASYVSTAGTYFIGVIAPGPTSGNNAGNNISNFVPFTVCAQSGCSSAITGPAAKFATPSSAGAAPQLNAPAQSSSRYQVVVADSAQGSISVGSEISRVFLRDTCVGANLSCTQQIFPVSVAWNGADPNGSSNLPSVTPDGRFVVFASEANNLVKGDSNGVADIFLRDTCIGSAITCVPATTRLSVGPDGEANGPSSAPAISSDGRFVVFNSTATNLVPLQVAASAPKITAPLFLRDTCFHAAPGCAPSTTVVLSAPAQPH
jgi:hypothetical protein